MLVLHFVTRMLSFSFFDQKKCDDNFFYIFAKKLKIILYGNIMETLGNKIQQISAFKYYCDICDYGTSRKCNYNTHIISLKHFKNIKMETIVNKNQQIQQKISKSTQHMCEKCDKNFKNRSGLWKHKQKCNVIDEIYSDNEDNEYMYQGINIKDKDALVLHLLKQNGELQNKIIEMASHSTITNNNNNNNNNSHNTTNNAFNLNFFLNETCKDAMNISDFVSSIKVNLADLENTGRQGYIEGITNIVLKNLNKVEQNMRPIHCSDLKREVFYIKENNEWQKENEEKPILTKAIKVIANENIKQIKHWRDKYPDCTVSDSKKNNLYLKIVSNSMNGSTQEEGNKNIDKIISNVAKEVTINKSK